MSGVSDTSQETVRAALRALGEAYANEMAEGVGFDPSSGAE